MKTEPLKERINKWYINFRKYLFLYKDGYYELPYICNSPQIMLESFKAMPYTKFNEEDNYIETNNPFTQGKMYFRELNEGLWITITEIEFKKRVSTRALFDNAPCDYYFLSHFRYTHKINIPIVNEVEIPEVGWGLYKPGTALNTYFEENDKGIFMDIIFNRAWFDKNIILDNREGKNSLKQYLESNTAFKIWDDIVVNSQESVNKMLEVLKHPKILTQYNLNFNILCLDLMMRFFQTIDSLHLITEKESMPEADRRNLAKVERMLINSLNTKFTGIEELAKTAHMSTTKLKTLFKKEYGKSIFEYYQDKQMQLALNLLKRADMSVKEVSHTMGYNSHSNFTTAFKKYYNYLPSEITKDA